MIYKLTACLINPEIKWQRERLGESYETVLEDYKVITNPCNSLEVQYECLKKYPIMFGFDEELNENVPYIIEEDNDGVYLYERINKID